MIWKNLEHLVSQTSFYGTQRQSYLKPINPGAAPVKPGQIGSLSIYDIYKTVYVQKTEQSCPAQFEVEIQVLLT